jgi:hypothetical protein
MSDPPRRLAWVALAIYVGAALGAHNLWPLSTFEMYGSTALDSASRIVVHDGEDVHEVERFSRWRCETRPSAEPHACLVHWPFFHMEAVDRAAIARIDAGAPPSTGARSVALVRRIWRLSHDGAPVVEDCVLARCEVAP